MFEKRMKKEGKWRILGCVLLAAMLFTLVGTTGVKAADNERKLNETEITVKVGEALSLKMENESRPSGKYTETWRSSDVTKATVDTKGNVTPLAYAEEVIIYDTVVMASGETFEMSCVVHVSDPQLPTTSTSMKPGTYWMIDVTGMTEYSRLLFESSDSSIVTVSPAGQLYAVNLGKAQITITADNRVLKYDVMVTNAKLNCTWILTTKGKKKQLSVSGQSGSTPVTWKSSNKSIATVTSAGMVTTKKIGNAYIIATVDGIELKTEVNCTYVRALKVINSGKKQLGKTYSQARRMSTNYFDCSSFVWRMYKKQKVYFGNKRFAPVAAEEARYMVRKKKVVAYKYVDRSKLRPGDVLFIKGSYNGRYKNICHTAFYIGNGRILHSTVPYVKYGTYDQYKTRIAVIARPLKS